MYAKPKRALNDGKIGYWEKLTKLAFYYVRRSNLKYDLVVTEKAKGTETKVSALQCIDVTGPVVAIVCIEIRFWL